MIIISTFKENKQKQKQIKLNNIITIAISLLLATTCLVITYNYL